MTKSYTDSYEYYRKYLEDSLKGDSGIKMPTMPMNPFLRFFFERSCEESKKYTCDWNILTKTLSEEWKKLSSNKRDYYQKVYEIRKREYNGLRDEYMLLTKKKKPVSAYARYLKVRYHQYAKEYPSYSSKDINKLVINDWKNTITPKEKAKYEEEYREAKEAYLYKTDLTDKIEAYKQSLAQYEEDLKYEKYKIMKKNGITKQARLKAKKLEKAKERQRKREARLMEKRRKKELLREQKKRERELKALKEKYLRYYQRKIREEAKESEKQKLLKEKEKLQNERQKAKEEEANRKKASAAAYASKKMGTKDKHPETKRGKRTLKEEVKSKDQTKLYPTSKEPEKSKKPAAAKGKPAKVKASAKVVKSKTKPIKKAPKPVSRKSHSESQKVVEKKKKAIKRAQKEKYPEPAKGSKPSRASKRAKGRGRQK